MNRATIILAAGQGTRMKSALPKVMHAVAGLPMLGHVLSAAKAAGSTRLIVVIAPGADVVRAFATAQGAECVVQDRQLGTGHAAACAKDALADFDGQVLIAYGDMPLVTERTLTASFDAQTRDGMALIAFTPDDAGAYGRVLTDKSGFLDRIVEYKDANNAERSVKLCNAGIMAADARNFFRWTGALKNENAQSEYYLTDVPALAKAEGVACAVLQVDAVEMMGVNSRTELAGAEAAMQKRLRHAALETGVGLIAPDTVYLNHDTILEADCRIGPYVVFGPKAVIRSGADIKAFCHIEGAEVSKGAIVGPYARLRPGARIDENAHIGNFVEVKNTHVEKGAKANHLTYLGDARVGAGANIGAGTITCNYDGFDKHFTDIGAGAFIGSNASLVAPVKIGDGAITGAGTVITENVAKDALAVTRPPQKEIIGWAEKFRARKKAQKENK